jgi:nicotinate-nucleotide pyrophosphorylase (carboxylating)
VLEDKEMDDKWIKSVEPIVDLALAEDLENGDITTEVVIPSDIKGKAYLVARESGIVAGLKVAETIFNKVDASLKYNSLVRDGDAIHPGDRIAEIAGPMASILQAERTALNFIQRLSGIATETAKYVAEISGTNAYVTDTRKTTPGLRILEKYAVKVGGGYNHRQNLGDGVLIKDNHLAVIRCNGIKIDEVIEKAREKAERGMKIEVEVESLDDFKIAMSSGADVIMLDNMEIEEMKEAVKMASGRFKIEASGNITIQNVGDVARTGVDYISIGSLTHSVKALDISLEVEMK